jgi:hypothetical protein
VLIQSKCHFFFLCVDGNRFHRKTILLGIRLLLDDAVAMSGCQGPEVSDSFGEIKVICIRLRDPRNPKPCATRFVAEAPASPDIQP